MYGGLEMLGVMDKFPGRNGLAWTAMISRVCLARHRGSTVKSLQAGTPDPLS